MSRKFSDSEIRAYTMNRHEEKILRSKLNKLKMDISTFHDTSAKQRQDLVTECKGIRMTSGGSPVPRDLVMDSDFDISKRVQRPWAYSVMETTYNAAYRDAVIPLPKQKRTRPKSEFSQRGLTPWSLVSSMDHRPLFETAPKGSSPNRLLGVVSASDSAIKGFGDSPSPTSHQPLGSQSARREKVGSVITPRVTGAPERSQTVPEIVIDSSEAATKHNAVEHDGHLNLDMTETLSPRETSHSDVSPAHEADQEPVKMLGGPIMLPPMYKIDSQAYQDAERERTIQRSRSRVSFSSNPTPVVDSHSHNVSKDKHLKTTSPEVSADKRDIIKHDSENIPEATLYSDKPRNDRVNGIMTLDPDSFHDFRIRKLDDVFYKGRKLKNYIRPEDRYKIDPLIMKRRQNKMDKLAKESVSFLKRVNHENINVEIAFPRSARKRILLKLVEENNSVKGRRVNDGDRPLIQKKVEYFMSSISDYIRQQQYEREQPYT